MIEKVIWEDWEGGDPIDINNKTTTGYNLNNISDYTDKNSEDLSVVLSEEKTTEGVFIKNVEGNNNYKIFLNKNSLYTLVDEGGIEINNLDLEGHSDLFKIEKIGGEDFLVTNNQIIKVSNGENIFKIIPQTDYFIIKNGIIYIYSENDSFMKKENNVIRFQKIEKINNKIIMYNNLGKFIIFDKNTDNVIYEGKKGEYLDYNIENDVMHLDNLKIKVIVKPYGINSKLNIETGEEIYDKYKDTFLLKYNFLNILHDNLKKKLGNLKIPYYFAENMDVDGFLNSPYCGDVFAILFQYNYFKRMTFKDILISGDLDLEKKLSDDSQSLSTLSKQARNQKDGTFNKSYFEKLDFGNNSVNFIIKLEDELKSIIKK